MNQKQSLDHDGLDGILASSHQPDSRYSYFRFLWLIPILILIASAALWLRENRQNQPPSPSARLGNLPHPSGDRITLAKNEAPVTSVSSQNAQPPASNRPDNVALPDLSRDVPVLPDSVHPSQSPGALENEAPQALESAKAETTIAEKPPVIETKPATFEKHKDISAKSLINENFKVNFKFASSEVNLSKTEKADLTRLVEKCDNQIEITGYTCMMGSPEFNQQLGLMRARALKRLLISEGVPANRILTASKGMQNPIAPNESLSGRGLNRRAELTCKGKP